MDAILEIAAQLGIPVPDAYRDGVIANHQRLMEQAGLVMAATLPEILDNHHADFVP